MDGIPTRFHDPLGHDILQLLRVSARAAALMHAKKDSIKIC